MGLDLKTLAVSKKYTAKTAEGMGAVKGQDGFSPIITENANNTESEYRLNITTKDGTFTTDNLKGIQGQQGEQGKQGLRGEQGKQGVEGKQGIQGEKGDDGYPFLIYKEYNNLSEFNKADFPEVGLMFMVKEEDSSAFPVYRYTGESDNPYSYITSLSGSESIKGDKGDKGDKGEQGVAGSDGTTYIPKIGNVTAGETASASLDIDEEKATAAFNFVLPKGDKGDDGTIPSIGKDNHWFIGEEDTGVVAEGKDGRSITSVTSDEDNNIIVNFSDNTSQNIGKLSVDVSADFLTDGGFGNLRYYNGKFQYYDAATGVWVDTAATPDNVLVVNMMPNPMRRIIGVYDYNIGHYKLKWQEPEDTVVDGQVICIVEKVVIRRKLGSVPANENDGDLVTVVERSEFGSHDKTWFADEAFSPSIGDTYYYKAFPMSTTGFYNSSTQNETGGILAKDYVLYGLKIDQNESDPSSMFSYLEDNAGFRSAYMDYASDRFNYADWEDAFFMTRPCMLKYDGTVDYYLNPDDYSLKEDGTPSDVADENYGGNAMEQVPKVYIKIVDNGDNTANVYFSNKKLDDGFKCWAHIDANGNEIPYCYMPKYNGYNDGTRLRSLSGKMPMHSMTVEQEIKLALANNLTDDVIWYIDVFCDWQLINLLLLLIGESGDTQAVFGTGNSNSYVSTSNTGVKETGILDTKGSFWGNQDNKSCVKVFGMENWWGNIWRRIAGWINDHGTQKVKMTYGQSDGSTVDGYNTTGDGYIVVPNATPSGTSGGYISGMVFDKHGLIPKIASGSATTYYTDGLWIDNSQVNYATVGSGSSFGHLAGALCSGLSSANWSYGGAMSASISCKPFVQGGKS